VTKVRERAENSRPCPRTGGRDVKRAGPPLARGAGSGDIANRVSTRTLSHRGLGTSTTLRRQLAIALTLLYLVMVGGVSLAHAAAEVSGPADVAHVVAPEKDRCPPVHDHVHCPACKVTGSRLVGAPSTLVRFEWPDRPVGVHRPLSTAPRSSATVAAPRSRGPPPA